MSPEAAAILGGVAGGLVGGLFALGGVLLGAVMRRVGRVHCEVRGWRVVPLLREETGGYRHIGANESVPFCYDGPANCYFRVYFFNERDLDTALLDVGVAFRWEGGSAASFPVIEGTSDQLMPKGVSALELPSRKAVTKDMMLIIANREGRRLMEPETVELRGYFPDGELFTKVIVG